MRALRSALPLLLVAAACATPAPETMSAEEAFLYSGPAPDGPPGSPPPTRAERLDANVSQDLRAALVAFSARARLHRDQSARGCPMPSLEVNNWLELDGALDAFLQRPARQTSSFDVVRARLTMEAELELDSRCYGEMPPDLAEGVLARISRLASRMAELRRLKVQTRFVSRSSFAWPIQPVAVTSLFGRRLHPIEGVYRQHQGVDLAAVEGQAVHAAADGVVIRAEWSEGHGNHVEVEHGGGIRTGYSHLSEILVEPGLKVRQGDLVGLAGTTGLSTGVHLHFEFWRDGRACDPLEELGQPLPGPVAARY